MFNFTDRAQELHADGDAGGRFVSVTIPNNWCGHGFYQFSPELFFRALGPENGFSLVEMYFADVEGTAFYRVADPAAVRERVQLWTSDPVFLLVHARRDAVRDVFATTPQQSDYVSDWSGDEGGASAEAVRGAGKRRRSSGRSAGSAGRCSCAGIAGSSRSRNRAFYQPADLRI